MSKCPPARPLYLSSSIWSAAPASLAELGIDADFSVVNLIEAENFSPEFLKLNPKATIPTLTHKGKSYTSTADVINYLVSISSIKVAPETSFTTAVHEDKVDPNFAFLAAVRPLLSFKLSIRLSCRSLSAKRRGTGPSLRRLREPLCLIAARAREKVRSDARGARKQALLRQADRVDHGPARDYQRAGTRRGQAGLLLQVHHPLDNIKAFTLETLPAAISEGPFIAGARPGVDDFHVAAWLARIAFLLGAQKSEEGVAALEKTFGTLPEKVKVFWAAWIARDSWVQAYPENQLC
ncbi:hypothetical protein BC826DRAFT_1066882 [Russula brevipes]|nr:hypothetical protein BC826DRAFT_1066882 [Russula brevipes]